MAQACASCGAPMVGGSTTCPACGNAYSEEYVGISETIPQVPSPNAPRPPDTMNCPMCSEPIPRASTRCKWCGENIGPAKGGMGAPRIQQPQPQPAYQPPPPPVQRPDATAALVVSILGLVGGFMCGGLGLLLSPFGWMMANGNINQCRSMGLEPDGSATAAKILGIIGTVLLGLGVLLVLAYIALVVLVVGSAAASSP